MRRLTIASLALTALLGAAPTAADAAIIFDFAPPFPANPDQNLLFNEPGLILSGTTVQGSLSSPAAIIDLTGLENLVASGGQAHVASTDNGFTYLLIRANDPNIGFTAFEANPDVFKPQGRGGPVSGTVNITVTDMNGLSASQSYAVNSSGSNYFNLFSTDHFIRSILIESTVDLAHVGQFRLGGAANVGGGSEGSNVPEPAGLVLLGLGLSVAAMRLRRKAA